MRPPANCWGGAQSLRGPAPGLGCQGERAGPLCRHGAGRRAPGLAVEQGVRGQRLLRAETALCPLQLPSRAPSRLAPCPITVATPSHDGRLLLPTRSHCFGDPSWSGVTCPLPPSPLPSAGKACEAGSCSQEPRRWNHVPIPCHCAPGDNQDRHAQRREGPRRVPVSAAEAGRTTRQSPA